MKAGMRKARVLPVPVCAMPMRSLPERRYGHACAWIGEGRSKPWEEGEADTCYC